MPEVKKKWPPDPFTSSIWDEDNPFIKEECYFNEEDGEFHHKECDTIIKKVEIFYPHEPSRKIPTFYCPVCHLIPVLATTRTRGSKRKVVVWKASETELIDILDFEKKEQSERSKNE